MQYNPLNNNSLGATIRNPQSQQQGRRQRRPYESESVERSRQSRAKSASNRLEEENHDSESGYGSYYGSLQPPHNNAEDIIRLNDVNAAEGLQSYNEPPFSRALIQTQESSSGQSNHDRYLEPSQSHHFLEKYAQLIERKSRDGCCDKEIASAVLQLWKQDPAAQVHFPRHGRYENGITYEFDKVILMYMGEG